MLMGSVGIACVCSMTLEASAWKNRGYLEVTQWQGLELSESLVTHVCGG